jgi:hypothetical protein
VAPAPFIPLAQRSHTNPPPTEAWWKIPDPVRRTLERSFVDRMAGAPGSERNLDNAFWGGGKPTTPWEAVQHIGPEGLSIVTRIHERMTRIDPSGAAWGHIRSIRNLWWKGSGGFKVTYDDREEMVRHVRGLVGTIAEDLVLGSLEHQRRSSLQVLIRSRLRDLVSPAALPPDAITFREVDRLGAEALHVCIARFEPAPTTLDDIHLDWVSPVERASPITRRCVYAFRVAAPHWIQAKMHVRVPVFPFDAVDAMLADTERPRRHGAERAQGWEAWRAKWQERRWDLAATGSAGHHEAMQWHAECQSWVSALKAE